MIWNDYDLKRLWFEKIMIWKDLKRSEKIWSWNFLKDLKRSESGKNWIWKDLNPKRSEKTLSWKDLKRFESNI